MRNEFTKRLKGLMALVLCFGMLFGNGLTVFAADHTIQNLGTGSVVNEGDMIKDGGRGTLTYSGNVYFYYKTSEGTGKGVTDQVYLNSSFKLDESHFVISEGGISSWKVDMVYWNPNDISSIMERNYKIELSRDTVNANGYDCLVVLVPNNASTESTNVGGGAGHTHTFEWDMVKEPTRTEDGEASYICHECGCVEATQPVTRWQWFMKQYRDLVKNAEQNATVTFEADDMPCISDYMLGFNAARPDVTVIVHFTYEGVNYELTIPAGTDFSAIQNDTDDFYGYLGLAAKLGLTAKVVG